jgi:hypothetical protein
MKKILLSICLIMALSAAKAQKDVVINEFVPDPNGSNEEYIELYNTTGAPVNLDCYTLVAYDFNAPGAVWVYQLPDVTIAPFGFVVFSSAKPVEFKFGTFDSTNIYSWNTANPNAALTHYVRSGNSLITPTSGPTTDFIPISGGNTAALAVMLFNGAGNLTNGFFTNNGSTVPVEVTTLSNLVINLPADAGSGCAATASLNFSGISAPEAEVLQVQQAVGVNNNYFRQRDGFCGVWAKGQNKDEYTPGKANSSLPPINTSTAITVTVQQEACGGGPGGTTTLWNIGVTVTDAGLLPATVRIYSDNDFSNTLTAADGVAVGGGNVATVNLQTDFLDVPIKKGSSVIVQIITASGCIQITRVFTTDCIGLPVNFKSFTAARNRSVVALKWETSAEQDNSGFAVERNIGGTWQEIAFVPTQAQGGNSSDLLTYTYNDLNTYKGISQYRLRQVDYNGMSKNSEIRSVRGEGQLTKTIVYPNPSADGKVNVVFEDANVTRNVSVIDMSGRIIKQWRNVTNNNLQIENLNAGVYSIRIVSVETGEQVVEKIVVNKR